MLLEKIFAFLSVLFLLLCMSASISKKNLVQRSPLLRRITGAHNLYGILLLIFALLHGMLAGNAPGMVTGKLIWTILLALILLSIFQKRRNFQAWKRIHKVLAVIVCILTAVHIGYAVVF